MSDTDSFIDEVTEEVRRDQLFAKFRRYGWIAVVAVVVIVGGASWNEYQKAQNASAAQANGDALINALEADTATARAAALADAELETSDAELVRQLLLSAQQDQDGDADGAAKTLDAFVATAASEQAIYRDLAELKLLSLGETALPEDQRSLRLEALAQPGQPFALLASEQLALIDIKNGETEAAIQRLQLIILDQLATEGLRQRSTQLIVALGGEPETLPNLGLGQ